MIGHEVEACNRSRDLKNYTILNAVLRKCDTTCSLYSLTLLYQFCHLLLVTKLLFLPLSSQFAMSSKMSILSTGLTSRKRYLVNGLAGLNYFLHRCTINCHRATVRYNAKATINQFHH